MDQPHVIVLFGATGDLSRRKLLPGMLHLFQAGLLKDSKIIGTSLDDYDEEQFRKVVREACEEFSGPSVDERWDDFAAMLSYVPQSLGAQGLAEAVHREEAELGAAEREVHRLHYLSVPPKAAIKVVHQLAEAKLVERSRIVME